MYASEEFWQQTVAGHRKPYSGLPQLEDKQRGDHPHHRPEQNSQPNPMQAMRPGFDGQFLEAVYHRGSIIEQGLPGNDSGEYDGHADIEHSADDESRDDPDRQIALRIAGLFGGRRNRIESDISEENDRAAGRDTRQ